MHVYLYLRYKQPGDWAIQTSKLKFSIFIENCIEFAFLRYSVIFYIRRNLK